METTSDRPDASRNSSSESVSSSDSMYFNMENCSQNAHQIASGNIRVDSSSNVMINYGKTDDGSDVYKPKAMAAWLRSSAASNYPARHNKHYKTKAPRTLEWAFQSQTYKDWIEGDGESAKRNLAYVGILGCGKSVLASAVIEDLQKRRNPTKDAILYAYFDVDDAMSTGSETGSSVLCDLLSQLIVGPGRNSTSEAVQDLYRKYETDAISSTEACIPERSDIIPVLRDEISNFSNVYIVIDALNVVPPQDQFRLVQDLLSLKIKLMITSRYKIPAAPDIFSHLLREDNANDISLFIQHRMEILSSENHPLTRTVNSWPQHKRAFIDRTIATADGMFSRARYVMDLVKHRLHKRDIDDVFDDLQKDFDVIYKLEVDRTRARWAKTKRLGPNWVLYWVSFTQRALTTEELQYALACQELDRTPKGVVVPDYASDMFDLSDILWVCDGFIIVKGNIIDFNHSSIRDYFERSANEYFKDTLTANPIATVCLCHIIRSLSTMPRVTSSADLDSIEWKDHLDTFPLFSYAVSQWGHHAFDAEKAGCLDKELVSRLFQHPASPFLASTTVVDIHPMPEMSPHAYEILFLARFGLNSMLTDLPTWVDVLNVQDAHGWTPLLLAAAGNNEEVVKTLLKHGADPKIATQTKETPLHRAAYNGHTMILLRLIATGAVIEAEDDCSRTPLSVAAKKGRQQVTEALLRLHAANPNVSDKRGKTPLHHAAGRGYEKIVTLLLNNNASVDALDEEGLTPLLYAASEGHAPAVAVLLKRRADPNFKSTKGAKENMGRTALHVATARGHSGVITVLLNHVPNVDVLDRMGRTPLFNAAENGHTQIVRTLLERGADPTLASETVGTPITQAAFMGYTDIFALFLEKGFVKPEETDSWGRGVISYAAEGGSVDILKLLLASDRFQLGQDQLDKPDKKLRAPISYAIRPQTIVLESFKRPMSGNIEFVKLLLGQPVRIDINRVDERNLTPARMAKDSRYRDIRSVVRQYASSADGP